MATQALTVRHHYPRAFDIRGYWDHQLGVGVCAKLLAQRLQDADPDILFTAGLLHDLGVLLTALYRPDDWPTCTVPCLLKDAPGGKPKNATGGSNTALSAP